MNNQRKLFKKLKKSKTMKQARALDYNKDGSVQINVGLRQADDFFSPFSYLSYEMLNPAVSDYIDTCEGQIPLHEELSIDIYTEENTDNEDKRRIRAAVKRHHAEEIVTLEKKLKRKTISGLIWTILGVVVLLAESIIYSMVVNMYLDTILAVMGWLFLWDGMEILLSDRASIKRKLFRSYRLMNAKVHVRKYSRKIQKEYGIGEFEEDDED